MSTEWSGGKTAEVIVMFEESVLAVRHLRAGERFRCGGASDDDLAWPLDGSRELVRVSPSGAIELVAAAELAAALKIELLDDAARPVAEGVHLVGELDTGARVATLPAGHRARLQLGEVALLVGEAEAPIKRALPPPIDLQIHRSTAAMALVFLLALVGIQALPPQPASLAVDPFELSMRGVRMRFQPPVEPPQPWRPSPAGTSSAPAPARRTSQPRWVRVAGEHGEARSHAPRSVADRQEEAQNAAANFGLLGTLHAVEGSHTGAVFGPGSALGDAKAAMGDLGGSLTGDVSGSAAIDRIGARPGGSTNTVGKWGRIETGEGRDGPGGFKGCSGCSNLHGRTPKMIADFTIPPPQVQGPLDKELIRRAVRSQSQAFRFCYERELQHNPELSGRVVTKFTIAPNGRIVGAVTESSTLKDPAVDACVAGVFKRIELPAMPPHMGISIVTYPLAFHAAAQGL